MKPAYKLSDMARIAALVLALCFAGCSPAASSQDQAAEGVEAAAVNASVTASRQNAITQAVNAATPAIVSVNVIEIQHVRYRDPFTPLLNHPFFRQYFPERQSRVIRRQVENLGSGFLISDDGYVVTNFHVAGNATRVTVSLASGETLEASLVGADKITDLALLKIESTEPLPHLRFAEDPDPIVGEWAIALGNPFGLFEASEPSVTVGVVSATGRDLGTTDGIFFNDMIQTDASINEGNSGGPLVNALGDVIGVNTVIYRPNSGSVGLGFAIPAFKARRIVAELQTQGFVDRAYDTGLKLVRITTAIANALDLDGATGVLIGEVDAFSPAARAGLRVQDLIVGLEDEPVDGVESYAGRLYDFRPGDVVTFHVLRGPERLAFDVHIGRAGD